MIKSIYQNFVGAKKAAEEDVFEEFERKMLENDNPDKEFDDFEGI